MKALIEAIRSRPKPILVAVAGIAMAAAAVLAITVTTGTDVPRSGVQASPWVEVKRSPDDRDGSANPSRRGESPKARKASKGPKASRKGQRQGRDLGQGRTSSSPRYDPASGGSGAGKRRRLNGGSLHGRSSSGATPSRLNGGAVAKRPSPSSSERSAAQLNR